MAKQPINRTTKYLFATLFEESKEFKTHYNMLKRIGLYLNDHERVVETGASSVCHIFVRVNIDESKMFDTSLNFFRTYSKLYADDYDINDSEHMIVFRVPDKYRHSWVHFRKGKYSLMYTKPILDSVFKNSRHYLIKYRGEALGFERCEDLGDLENELSTEEMFNDLKLSSYYVLTQDNRLREMLELLLGVEIDEEAELDDVPDMTKEIFRFMPEVYNDIALYGQWNSDTEDGGIVELQDPDNGAISETDPGHGGDV